MPWIESHQSLSRHRKTLHAVALLQVDKHKLIGHLHELWWWGLDNADIEGSLGHTPPAVIAQAAEWPIEDADRFVDALITARFMARLPDGALVLHDWYDYAGRLAESREDGRRGNHERWHVQRGVVDPTCRYCRSDSGANQGRLGGRLGGDIGGDSPPESTNLPNQDNLPNQEEDDDAREAAPLNSAAAVPDERTDDTPARRQVIEHYCRATQRTPFAIGEDDRRDIEAALELTGGDPAPIIAAMEALLARRKQGPKRGEPIASFAYFLSIFKRQAPAEIAAARDSPSGKGRPQTNGGVTRGTKGGDPGEYDDGEYAGVFGDG